MIQDSPKTEALPAEFWQLPKDVLLYKLGSDPNGLSQSEAERRLTIFGSNRVEASTSRSILRKIGRRVLNPLVAMLVVAAAASGVSEDVDSSAISSLSWLCLSTSFRNIAPNSRPRPCAIPSPSRPTSCVAAPTAQSP